MIAWIVMPARNEERRIGPTLERYAGRIRGMGIGIVVVSSSSDGTDRIVSRYSRRYNFIRLVKSREREGKGGAIIKGFMYAMKDSPRFIGFLDADGSVDCDEFLRMLSILKKDKHADGVIASRYSSGSKINGRLPTSRFIASRAYNTLVRLLFKIDVKDTQCGAKIFRADALSKAIGSLTILGMSFDVDLLYSLKLDGKIIRETGVKYDQSNEGTSISIARNAPQMLIATLGFRVYKSRFAALVPKKLMLFIYSKINRW
ncbi:MAG: glycosyltransferase [Candidatus Marsarchaeota archaeon]|jgi:glycosyltransferase involved in cell wall biosynthesis|nr:glycosyltransferase [Candidatus Marsarchaeota archaeon]MCL5115498.1 glycosyltransferase [Candidatus Marsarchaeota archaeon]